MWGALFVWLCKNPPKPHKAPGIRVQVVETSIWPKIEGGGGQNSAASNKINKGGERDILHLKTRDLGRNSVYRASVALGLAV